MQMNWNNKALGTAKKALAASTTVPEAAARMGVTRDQLDKAFSRAGLNTPQTYLHEQIDPVAVSVKKEREQILRATNEDLIEQLKIEKEKNALLNRLARPRKLLEIHKRERASGLREMTALCALSDCHVEEEVKPIKVAGRNKYTLAIADARLTRYFEGIVDLVWHHRSSKSIAIRDVLLWLGGDLMTGHIHEEMLMTSQLTPIETLLWLHPRIAAGIRYLLTELDLESLNVLCDFGNHGRTTKFRNITTGAETSYEWGLYCQLAREFADDKRVRFDTSPANDHYAKIYGFTLHTTHGDSLRYAGGVGGLTIPLLKAVSSWDTDIHADWHMIGHFHTALDVDKAIANGSLIGWGAYSKWIKCRYNARDLSQHFSLIDKDRGRCHSTPIWVSSRKDEMKFWSAEEKALCTTS